MSPIFECTWAGSKRPSLMEAVYCICDAKNDTISLIIPYHSNIIYIASMFVIGRSAQAGDSTAGVA
jgi:hypothetical protein